MLQMLVSRRNGDSLLSHTKNPIGLETTVVEKACVVLNPSWICGTLPEGIGEQSGIKSRGFSAARLRWRVVSLHCCKEGEVAHFDEIEYGLRGVKIQALSLFNWVDGGTVSQ